MNIAGLSHHKSLGIHDDCGKISGLYNGDRTWLVPHFDSCSIDIVWHLETSLKDLAVSQFSHEDAPNSLKNRISDSMKPLQVA